MKTKITTHNENPRAAIVAKYAGATNSHGSRIIIKSQRSRRSYPYPHDLSGADCHKWAVSQYLTEILKEDRKEYGELASGWGTLADFSVGQIPSGEYVFVSNAAAPDLLEALRFLLADYIAIQGDQLTGSSVPLEMAQAAISKAKGEA